MVPDLDLQLQVAIKALRDAVAPAVDPGNRAAVEQLNLTIATLGMVRERLPLAHRLARRRLADALALADALIAAAAVDPGLRVAALADEVAGGRAALASPETDTAMLEGSYDRVNQATVALIAAAQGGPARAAIDRAVWQGSAPVIETSRAWCLPAGFEPDPKAVRPIADLL